MKIGTRRPPWKDPAHVPPRQFSNLPDEEPPAASRRRRGGKGWLVVLAIAVLSSGGYLVNLNSRAQPPASGPLPAVTQASPASKVERVLMANKLYSAKLAGRCPQQGATAREDAYRAQVRLLLDCLDTVWKPVIEKSGHRFRAVKHKFFADATTTPCGAGDEYAFYCETNSTIYLSSEVFEAAKAWRLSTADTVIHEYGHHVQSMAGMFAAAEQWEDPVVQLREELQVFCWTYYTFDTVDGFDLTADDRQAIRTIWGHTDDPRGHGSVAAQQLWGGRGLDGRNLGACNTWSAQEAVVR